MIYKTADITKYLKNPDLKIKCVVIYGSNEGMVADYVKQFAQSVCPDLNDAFRVASFNMDTLEKDFGVLYGEYNAQSLWGGRRVIVIKDATNNLTNHLKSLFKDSKSDTLIIASSSTLNSKSSLILLAKDNPSFALISCYDDRDENIFAFAREQFIQAGITVSGAAMELLRTRLSSDRKASASEIAKLITYLGTRRNIEIQDVQNVISDTSSATQEDLCFFTAGGDLEKALDSYRELLMEGTDPVPIARSITYHFLRLLNGVSALEKGQSAESFIAAQRPPVMFYRKADFLRQLKIWQRKAILDVLELLYRCERDCKTTNFPAQEILSYTIMQIATAARKINK